MWDRLIFCVKYTFFLFIVLCASIVTPSSGNVSLSYHNTVTSAQFDCATGYYISGALSATCRADGTWNKPPPTCSKFDITKIWSKRRSIQLRINDFDAQYTFEFETSRFNILGRLILIVLSK